MRFDTLPEIPKIWIDFLQCRLSITPAPCGVQALPAHVDALKKRAKKYEDLSRLLLGKSGSVAVVADISPGLFGGPAAQILKCLTAIKVCEELAKHDLAAVPVCWIDAAPTFEFSMQSVKLLDQGAEIHCLQLQKPEGMDLSPGSPLPWNLIAPLLSQIEELGRGTFDSEVLRILRDAFSPGKTFSSACAHLISDLMKEWGMVVVDASVPPFETILTEAFTSVLNQVDGIESLLQKHSEEPAGAGCTGEFPGKAARTILARGLALPVAACIIDPWEVHTYARVLPVFDEIGFLRPLAWPQASATIVDARSRRILERYKLSIEQLYEGAEEAANRIRDAVPHSAPGKLDNLKLEVETRLADLGTLAPAGSKFAKTSDSCRRKIVYQLEKLARNCAAAGQRKEQAARRQLHKACNWLAPDRRAQERELAGIQIPLRYSRAGLRSVYEKLDILTIEHQLIPMD